MYVFTNTKKADIISAQKYPLDLPNEQIYRVIAENESAIGPAIQQMKQLRNDLQERKEKLKQ